MSEENKYNLDDLFVSAFESKPLDFENAFDSIIKDRISNRIEDIKQNVAQSIFNRKEEGTNDGEED